MPYYSLNLSQITLLTTHLQEQILESPAVVNESALNDLGFNTITGVEFKDVQFINLRKGGTTRPYSNGSTIASEVGKLIQRELVAKLSWNRVVDNIQNYREKEPFHIDEESFEGLPNSEMQIKSISTEYAEDVFSGLFHGAYNASGTNSLSLYDGVFTLFKKKIDEEYTVADDAYADKTKYTAKGANAEFDPAKQIIPTSAFADVTEATKTDNWDEFVAYINALPVKLRKAPDGVIVYMSDATKTRIVDSYARTYPAFTPVTVGELGFGFMNLPKVTIVSHPVIGNGDMLLASTKGNFDFGIDSLNNLNKIETDKMQEDFNNIIFQIQSAQGCRVRYFDAAHMAWNGKLNVADTTLAGDYQ